MAVSIIQQPEEISFSRNANYWKFKTDNLYSNVGTASAFLLSFPNGPLTDGQSFDLTYNEIIQTFIAKNAPDDSGLQIRSGAGLSMLDWCNQFIADIQANFLLSRDYLIELDLLGVDPRVKLLAKNADSIYDISLSAQAFVNSIILANGIKKARHPSFGIWMQLLVSNADNTAFEVVQTDVFLDVNDEGEATPDFRKTLTESLIGVTNDFEQPDPAQPAVQRNRKSCRRYYIRYAESYGSKQSIKKIKETQVKWVLFGGTGKAEEKNYSIPAKFFVGGYHLFLKQEAATKTVNLTQCEWLSLVWLTGPIALINYHVKVYFTAGAPEEFEAYTAADVLKYDKITFPAGPSQLNFPALYPAKTVAYYEVWLTDGAGARLSEIRTYQLNYKYEPYAKWFSFLSSMGSYDTIATLGAGSTEYDLITQTAAITKTDTFKFEEGETFEFGTQLDIKENILSGWIRTKRELKRYRDFFLSWNKFQVRNNLAYPVMLNSKSIKELKDADHLFYIEFETGYRFTEEAWSEEDEDAAPGVPVDVSQFWPAVSNPDPVDYDHLYYRKTATYNRAEIDAFIANVLAIESNNHAAKQGQIDALLLAMGGKSDTDHHHDGIYVKESDFNDFADAVGLELRYKGLWDPAYTVDPTDVTVLPGYAINHEVAYAGTLWRSLIIENTFTPGTDATKWIRVVDSKTSIAVPSSAPLTINWQNDLITGKTYTYAHKHGNDGFGFDGLFTDGGVDRGYKPTVAITRDGGLITSVEFSDLFPGQIIIS